MIETETQTPNQKTTEWLPLLLPYAFQAFVLILLTIILIWGEASQLTDAVISALLVVGTGSAIAGGSTATAHIISQSKQNGAA